MSDQERIDAILRTMRTQLETHLEEESKITDPIEYEKHLVDIGKRFSVKVLKSGIKKMQKSCNQKKVLTTLDRIELPKSHLLCPIEPMIPKLEETTSEDSTHVMMDGAMLLTRPKEWQELKLARIFKGSKVIDI